MNASEKLTTIAENVPKVYEAGKSAEWNKTWDALQVYGKRTAYLNEFQYWEDDAFYSKYDINIVGSGVNAFGYMNAHSGGKKQAFDFAGRLEECGVKLDTSKCTNFNYMFNWSLVTHIPEMDFSSRQENWSTGVFNGANIKTIDKIILLETGQPLYKMLSDSSATRLENVKIEGLITENVTIASAYLSADSAKSFISHLKNYAGTDEELNYSFTIKSAVWTRLNESGAPPSENTWEDYVISLGYNVQSV